MASPTRKPEPQVRQAGSRWGPRLVTEGQGLSLRHPHVQVLAALLHALPLKEDLEEWVTVGRLFSFLYQSSPDQVSTALAALGWGVQWRSSVGADMDDCVSAPRHCGA